MRILAGVCVSTLSCILLWLSLRPLLPDAIVRLLSGAQIETFQPYYADGPQLGVRLLDGSTLEVALTWQRSGLISALIFGLLFAFFMLPLRGPVWLKMFWLELGFLAGFAWSFIRLLVAVFASYYLGAGAFTFAEFFAGPFSDLLWVITIWSLALSVSASKKREKAW